MNSCRCASASLPLATTIRGEPVYSYTREFACLREARAEAPSGAGVVGFACAPAENPVRFEGVDEAIDFPLTDGLVPVPSDELGCRSWTCCVDPFGPRNSSENSAPKLMPVTRGHSRSGAAATSISTRPARAVGGGDGLPQQPPRLQQRHPLLPRRPPRPNGNPHSHQQPDQPIPRPDTGCRPSRAAICCRS
jgi:hypothetical protein